MVSFKKMLEFQLKRHIAIKRKLDKSSYKKVKGSLRLSKSNSKVQYYYCLSSDDGTKMERKYINKDEMFLARRLAMKDYYIKLDKLVSMRIRQLEFLYKSYEDDEIEAVYDRLNMDRKKLITPIEPTWKAKVAAWKAQPYMGLGFAPNAKVIVTNKGERVRSKTEKIMADRFFGLGIEYKYECPLVLANGSRIYPDFTFLSPYNHREIYWEHFGMMGDPEYAEKAIKKIGDYAKNGIFVGEGLIVTFESSDQNMDQEVVDIMIRKYLIYNREDQ